MHIRDYAVARAKLPTIITPSEHYSLIREAKGNYFPFGLKAYRLRMWARAATGIMGFPLRVILRIVGLVWSFFVYCPALCIYLVWTGWTQSTSAHIGTIIANIISACLLVYATYCLAAEAVICFRKAGSWGQVLHGLTRREERSNADLFALFGLAYVTFLSSTTLFFLISSFYPYTFGAIEHDNGIERLGDSMNSAVGTLVFFGDPEPTSGLGKLASDLVGLSGVLLVAFVVVLVVSSISDANRAPSAWTSPSAGDDPERENSRELDVVAVDADQILEMPSKHSRRVTWTVSGVIVGIIAILKIVIRAKTGL